jgi:hypothetical protein
MIPAELLHVSIPVAQNATEKSKKAKPPTTGQTAKPSTCGEPEYRQFLSMAADESVYNGFGNPY